MINVIIPITSVEKGYAEMIGELAFYDELNVLVGIWESCQDKIVFDSNVKTIVFKDGTNKEQMINSLSMLVLAGKILILRRALGRKDLEKFLSSNESIVLGAKKKRNKVASFFVGIWHKFIKLIFGVGFFEGDTSAIMFDEDFSEVLLQAGNISYNSRVNRFRGVTEKTVEIAEGKADPYPIDKKQTAVYSSISAGLVAVAVLVTVLLCLFVNISFIIGLLIACVDIICVFMAGIFMMMLFFNRRVGKRFVGEGEIVASNVAGEQ